LQTETPVLIDRLLKKGYQVLLETNGSLDISAVNRQCVRIMDIKCPGSGMVEKNDLKNIERLSAGDEVKFVISDEQDFAFAKEMTEAVQRTHQEDVIIHFSPVFNVLYPEKLAQWILENHLRVHLQLQLHKILWPGVERGV